MCQLNKSCTLKELLRVLIYVRSQYFTHTEEDHYLWSYELIFNQETESPFFMYKMDALFYMYWSHMTRDNVNKGMFSTPI